MKKYLKNKKFIRIGLVSCLFIILLVNFFGEQLPARVNEGLGWDGKIYADITANFKDKINSKEVNAYYIQRIIPCAIVHYSLKFLKQPFTPKNIIIGFKILNCVIIILSVLLVLYLSNYLKLSLVQEILAFSLIFFNYPILKFSSYYAVLTDVSAFGIGVLIAFSFFTNRKLLLAISVLIGSFIFPTIIYTGILLLPFEMESIPKLKTTTIISKFVVAFNLLFIISFIVFLNHNINLVNKNIFPWTSRFVNQINFDLLLLSFIFVTLYIFYFFNRVFDSRLDFFNSFKKVHIKNILLALLVLVSYKYIICLFTNKNSSYEFLKFLQNIFIQSVTNPLNFLIAHIVYYGPLILLILFFFRDFIYSLRNFGLGLFLFISVYVFFMIGSESRQFINAIPIFAIVLVKSMQIYEPKIEFGLFIAGLALFMSKFWFKINVPGIFTKAHSEIWLVFPQQRYSMSQGPWTSNFMYVINSFIIVLLGLLIYFLYIKKMKIKGKT